MQWNSDQSRFSLASAEADFDGVTMRGLQGITITDEVATDPAYGNGSIPIGAPAGTYKGELTFSTIPEEADNILQALGQDYSRVLGTVGITMNEPNGNSYLIELSRVKITKVEANLGEAGGQKISITSFTCLVMDPPNFNGVSSISDPTGFGSVVLSAALSVSL